MFCILIGIIFLILYPILGIFSKDFRRLSKKAFSCAFKKITLKPCDVDFGKEVKDKIMGKVIFKYPNLAKFIDKTASFWAFSFIIINILALGYFLLGALNLFVYDTCYPTNGESCSLSGEACSVNVDKTPTLFETLGRVPDRFKVWVAAEYISSTPTYEKPFDKNKEIAVDVLDPLCQYCKTLWSNINDADFSSRYNLTYILYPIPNNEGGYKFKHSYTLAKYIEALKKFPLKGSSKTGDWLLLNSLFTQEVNDISIQNVISISYTDEDLIKYIETKLKEYGYTQEEIIKIKEASETKEVKDYLTSQKSIVEDKIKTIKIPTLIFNGKRFDRVISTDQLSN